MKTREITIAGKQVTLAYCYATEIGFKDLADQDINDWMAEAVEALQAKRMPDIKKTIFAILASQMAYCNAKDVDATIADNDLINDATPDEIGIALGTLIALRSEFYYRPSDEPDDKAKGDEKNA